MQHLDFGSIEHLVIRDGEPVLDPPPRFVRDVKFGSESRPRPESKLDDFALKAQILDMFAHLDDLGNGTIRSLEVKHGLPFRMKVEDTTAL
jgi:hypothetical protein